MTMLVSCGDSFFFGDDLSDCPDDVNYSRLTWPALLANRLGMNYECLAKGGVGNLRILEQIISGIKRYGNSAIFVINWTWIDRFDYIRHEDDTWQTIRPSSTEKISEIYFRNFSSQEKDQFQTLTYIDCAYNLLSESRCIFFMTYMDPLTVDTRYHNNKYLGFLQKRVSSKLQSFDGKTFLQWSRSKGFKESAGWHPLEDAHLEASEYWLPLYKNRL